MKNPLAGAHGSSRHDGIDFSLAMAYQPIVDLDTRRVMAYEALVRGPQQESAASILARVHTGNCQAFDQACRVQAIETAAWLGLRDRLSINFMPSAMNRPETCFRETQQVCHQYGIRPEQIIFEITEAEKVEDPRLLARIANHYKQLGFRTAIDDFGAGYAGLSLLANFQPDYVKLDMELVREIHLSRPRQAIVRGMQRVCDELGIEVIVEGVESLAELEWFRELGFRYYQGYLLAMPGFEQLPEPDYSALGTALAA